MFFSSGQKQDWMKNRVRKRKKSGKKRKGRKQISNKRQLAITILFLAVFISILHSSFLWKPNSVSGISPKQEEGSDVGSRVLPAEDGPCGRPEITEDFLDKNPYSRSGIALRKSLSTMWKIRAVRQKRIGIILIICKTRILPRQVVIILLV